MPRVNGSWPGSPSRAAGSKPVSASGPYTTSTGMPDSVNRGTPRSSRSSGAPVPGSPDPRSSGAPVPGSPDPSTGVAGPLPVTRSSMPTSLPSGGRAEAGQEGAQLLAGAGPVGGGGLEQDRVAAAARQEGEVVAVPRPPVQHHGELPFGGGAVLEGGRPQADALVVASRVPGHEGALQAALGGQRRQAVAGRLDAEEAAAVGADEVGEGAPRHRRPAGRVGEPVGAAGGGVSPPTRRHRPPPRVRPP